MQLPCRTAAKHLVSVLAAFLLICSCLPHFAVTAYANEDSIPVAGRLYKFDENDHYEFSSAGAESVPTGNNTSGAFSILGEVKGSGSRNGIPAFSVSSGNINFYYSYKPPKSSVNKTVWHPIKDKSKKIDSISLAAAIASIAKGKIDDADFMREQIEWKRIKACLKTNGRPQTSEFMEDIYILDKISRVTGLR